MQAQVCILHLTNRRHPKEQTYATRKFLPHKAKSGQVRSNETTSLSEASQLKDADLRLHPSAHLSATPQA
jgi:hypothetical protein